MPVLPSPDAVGLLAWLCAVPVLTFVAVFATSGMRRAGRPVTSVTVILAALALTAGFIAWSGDDIGTLSIDTLAPGLLWGAAVGLVAGVFIASRSRRPRRLEARPFAVALLWDAGAFGLAEGLLLNGLPALVGSQLAFVSGAPEPWPIVAGVAAGVLCVVIDHLAYPETRQVSTLAGVAVAGGALSLAFLVTGCLLAAMAGHAVVHACVVLSGGEVPPYDGSPAAAPARA